MEIKKKNNFFFFELKFSFYKKKKNKMEQFNKFINCFIFYKKTTFLFCPDSNINCDFAYFPNCISKALQAFGLGGVHRSQPSPAINTSHFGLAGAGAPQRGGLKTPCKTVPPSNPPFGGVTVRKTPSPAPAPKGQGLGEGWARAGGWGFRHLLPHPLLTPPLGG